MTMLSLYEGTVKYIIAQQHLLGAEHSSLDDSRKARISHFILSLPAIERDIGDSAQVTMAIGQDTPAFDIDQRKEMCLAVAAHMKGGGSNSRGNASLQKNVYFHEYITEGMWSKLKASGDSTWDNKAEDLVDFAIERIGIINPNDDTIKNMVAILDICHQRESTPDDGYASVTKLKDKFVNKRSILRGNQTMLVFPSDVADFVRLFPNRYLQCDPPIASRIDSMKIRQATRKDRMPTRSTNKNLKSNESKSQQPVTDASSGFAMQCMQFIMNRGGGGGFPVRDSRRDSRDRSSSPEAPKPKALEDRHRPSRTSTNRSLTEDLADIDTSTTEPAGPPPLADVPSVSPRRALVPTDKGKLDKYMKKGMSPELLSPTSMIDHAKRTLASKKDRRRNQSKAKDDDDADSNASDEEPLPKKQKATPIKKKPSAATLAIVPAIVPANAAAILKKPSAAVIPVDPKNPPPTFEKTSYNGGKIYWNASGQKFRAFARRGDRYEKAFRVDNTKNKKSMTAAWAGALAYIDADKRAIV